MGIDQVAAAAIFFGLCCCFCGRLTRMDHNYDRDHLSHGQKEEKRRRPRRQEEEEDDYEKRERDGKVLSLG
jgi:hypothetical protein